MQNRKTRQIDPKNDGSISVILELEALSQDAYIFAKRDIVREYLREIGEQLARIALESEDEVLGYLFTMAAMEARTLQTRDRSQSLSKMPRIG